MMKTILSFGDSIVSTEMSKPYFIFLFLTVILFTGCASGQREMVEDRLNNAIGNSIKGTYLEEPNPTISKIDHGDTIEYIQKGELSGCTIIYMVEKETKQIQSWKYGSSPEKCWTGKGSY